MLGTQNKNCRTNSLVGKSVLDSGVSLFGDRFSDTLVSWERDERLGALAEKEDVGGSGGKGVAGRVLDGDDVETTWVSLSALDGTDSTDVLATDDVGDVTGLEFDPVGDFGGLDVELDGVTNSYVWVGVSEGSAVVCDEEWHVVLGGAQLLHSAQLVGGLFGSDSVDGKSTFGVIDQSKVLFGLFDGNDIHVAGWVFDIGSYLAVDLDHAAHHNLLALFAAKSIFESVSDEDGQWQALAELVWAGTGSEGVAAGRLWQHPVVRRCQSFQMFLRSTTSHDRLFFVAFLGIF